MTKDFLTAQRYAQALFELANEQREDEFVEAELEALSAALKASPETERFLGNPALSREQKRKVIERLFTGKKPAIEAVLVKFLLLLFDKHRFYLLHDVAASYRKIADESQGQGVVEIRSASPISDGQRAAIVSRMEKRTGKKMAVRSEVDARLLGGVIVKVGNKVLDDSVRTKIGNFKKELMKTQSI